MFKFNPMIFTKMPKPIARALGRAGLALKRYLPEILTGVGIASGVGAIVTACQATTKLEPILDEHKEAADKIKVDIPEGDKARGKEMTKLYASTGKKLAKLYWLPAALEGLSVACQIGSTGILRKDNKALTAAYMGLLEAYRRQQAASPKIETAEGEKSIEDDSKETDEIVMSNCLSPYAVTFGKDNRNWRRRASDNECFLIRQMNAANDMLHSRGHVFLNEVYDLIGMPRTEAGQFVGWVEGMGDSMIDFNIMQVCDADGESMFWLDFNVDGSIMYIFDKLWEGNGKDVPFIMND